MPRDSYTHAMRGDRIPADVRTDAPESAAGQALSLLIEIDRKTPTVERIYTEARQVYLEAARQLVHHRARFDQRAAQLVDLGGSHTFTPPADVDLVTAEELQP